VSEDIGAQLVLGDRPIEITVCGWLSVQYPPLPIVFFLYTNVGLRALQKFTC
jgi:hypothetical protein